MCTNIGLNIDGNICFDRLKVAETFNRFYTSVASKLVQKLPSPFYKYGKNFVSAFYTSKGVFPNSFSFSIVSENKVFTYLNNLSANNGIASILLRTVHQL